MLAILLLVPDGLPGWTSWWSAYTSYQKSSICQKTEFRCQWFLAVHLQENFKIEDADDLRHDFERLQQAMEMVGFLPATKRQ